MVVSDCPIKTEELEVRRVNSLSADDKEYVLNTLSKAMSDDLEYSEIAQHFSNPREMLDWVTIISNKESNSDFFVIWNQGTSKVFGFISWTSRYFLPADMRSFKMYISPKYRGKGLAKELAKLGRDILPQGLIILGGVHKGNKPSNAVACGSIGEPGYNSTTGYRFYQLTEASKAQDVATRIQEYQVTLRGDSYKAELNPHSYIEARLARL